MAFVAVIGTEIPAGQLPDEPLDRALTVRELAAVVYRRYPSTTHPTSERRQDANRFLTWATLAYETINVRAPAAPWVAKNEAAVRFCGYLADDPTFNVRTIPGSDRRTGFPNLSGVFVKSGAGSVLGPWVAPKVSGAL